MPFRSATLMTASSIYFLEIARNSNRLLWTPHFDLVMKYKHTGDAFQSFPSFSLKNCDVVWSVFIQDGPHRFSPLESQSPACYLSLDWLVEESRASPMAIHPHQCPFSTLFLWSFFAQEFLSYVWSGLRNLRSHGGDSHPKQNPRCSSTSELRWGFIYLQAVNNTGLRPISPEVVPVSWQKCPSFKDCRSILHCKLIYVKWKFGPQFLCFEPNSFYKY